MKEVYGSMTGHTIYMAVQGQAAIAAGASCSALLIPLTIVTTGILSGTACGMSVTMWIAASIMALASGNSNNQPGGSLTPRGIAGMIPELLA
jgi:hypothetical protein